MSKFNETEHLINQLSEFRGHRGHMTLSPTLVAELFRWMRSQALRIDMDNETILQLEIRIRNLETANRQTPGGVQ